MGKLSKMIKTAYHFLPDDRKLRFGDDKRIVEPGMEFSVNPDKLKLCSYGLHASIKPLDALTYAPGSVLTKCELSGKILESGDKLCAEKRKVLWVFDASDLLHTFACDVAEDALSKIKNPDPRSLKAIETKRAWLIGEVTGEQLRAAYSAADRAAHWAKQNAHLEQMIEDAVLMQDIKELENG